MSTASWLESYLHSLSRDQVFIESRDLKKTFKSPDDESARLKAKEILRRFKKALSKEAKEKRRPGHRVTEPRIKSQLLRRIYLINKSQNKL